MTHAQSQLRCISRPSTTPMLRSPTGAGTCQAPAARSGVPSVGAVAAGQYFFQTSGWSELVLKRPAADDEPTIQQQYDCHVLYGYNIAGAGVHWDLGMFRSNNSVWALQSPFSHTCN